MEKAALEQRVAELRESLAKVEGTRTEVYARIVGYYRSVRNWNAGKREEYARRRQWSLGGNSGGTRSVRGERAPDATWLSAEAEPRTHATWAATSAPMSASPTLGRGIEALAAERGFDAVAVPHGPEHTEAKAATWDVFVRASCPGCPPVKAFLAASGLGGRVIDVDDEAGLQEALAAGVLSTPTALIKDAAGRELYRARTVTELRASLMPVLA